MDKYAAIVLAAGNGSRMKRDTPKQFLPLNGKPLLYYSLKAFQESPVDRIILVTAEQDIVYCREQIVEKEHFSKVTDIVAGGQERFWSVYKGIQAVSASQANQADQGNEAIQANQANRSNHTNQASSFGTDIDYVLIHDGARPFIDIRLIVRMMEAVRTEKACIPAIPVKDTIKIADESGYIAASTNRKSLRQVQTPQAFLFPAIRVAYEKLMEDLHEGKQIPDITDDAMVYEHVFSDRIRLVEGSERNFKITTPEDLRMAEAFLKA